MISNRARALDEGRQAAILGQDIDKSNPYQPGIDDHENFREGFLETQHGKSAEEVQALEPAPPAPTAVGSTPATKQDDIVSEHPATNVESVQPYTFTSSN